MNNEANDVLKVLIEVGKTSKSKRGEQSEQIFNYYRRKDKIAEEMLNSFLGVYQPSVNNFTLDDDENKAKFGLITYTMALSTFLELQSLGADISKCADKFYAQIQNIFDSVYSSKNAIFDASPYLSKGFQPQISDYVESVSKVLIASVDLRDYLSKHSREDLPISIKKAGREIYTVKDLISWVEILIVDCLKSLNASCLENKELTEYRIDNRKVTRKGVSATIDYRGWSFCKPMSENVERYNTSLYYTYHATNAYLALYNSFRAVIDKEYEGIEYEPGESVDLKENEREELAGIRLKQRFYDGNHEVFDEFRKKVISAGRYIENQLSEKEIDLSFDYINKDLNKVSIDTVMNGSNNCLIDTLFVIAILINCGVDDDYASVGKLNEFYEMQQNALANVRKIYSKMVANNRDDLIGGYSLGNEECSDDGNRIMQEMRKNCKTVSPYDFVPLYCNTYYTVSDFLIKYPQIEMKNNLRLILDNKRVGEADWLWSKGKYDINNNLYYIFALENFYGYYDTYEKQFVSTAEAIKNIKSEKAELEARYKNNELVLKEEFKEKEADFQRRLLEKSDLEKAVIKCIEENIAKIADVYFEELLDEGITYISKLIENYDSLNKSMLREEFNNNPRLSMLFKISYIVDAYRGISEEKKEKLKRENQETRIAMLRDMLPDNILKLLTQTNGAEQDSNPGSDE